LAERTPRPSRLRAALVVVSLISVADAAAAGHDARLLDAVRRADGAAVRALLNQHVDVNQPQADGATALHWAVYQEELEIVDLLINAGAVLNARNDLGVTPLWLACATGNARMLERLLKHRADPNAALPSGETPLMTAAQTGNLRAVALLLASGADVNRREQSHGQTALMWAVAQRQPSIVQALLAAGADVHARSTDSPQFIGTGEDKDGATEIRQGGFTPLLFATRVGDLESARLLVAAGANVNDVAASGTSALVIAAHSGHGSLAVFLLDKGADPQAAAAGYTALHAAILRADEALATALLAHGANPNTPLMKPTPARRLSADYSLGKPLVGATPVWLAAKFNQPAIMRALAAKGADARVTKGATTALVAAIEGPTRRLPSGITVDDRFEAAVLDTVRLAVELGNDVNAANDAGDTPVHCAARAGLPLVVKFLADRGAVLDAKNKDGQTPLTLAMAPVRPRSSGGVNTVLEDGRRKATDLLRSLGGQSPP
jgi:ankyrin repeat protein